MYYLDRGCILQESRYTERKGWRTGDIGEMDIRTSVNTSISAIQFGGGAGGVRIRVYYQGVYYLPLN